MNIKKDRAHVSYNNIYFVKLFLWLVSGTPLEAKSDAKTLKIGLVLYYLRALIDFLISYVYVIEDQVIGLTLLVGQWRVYLNQFLSALFSLCLLSQSLLTSTRTFLEVFDFCMHELK